LFMMTVTSTQQISPEHMVAGYTRFYHAVYGRQPRVRHMGQQWYQVDGELVHYRTLLESIGHLRALAKRKSRPEKGLVTRLIERLRLL
ncbi:MAG: hypothetical protein AAF125_15090, partial [Chloroflexota bacterium]